MKFAYTYIMTNKGHSVLYTGCTNDLVRRVKEQKTTTTRAHLQTNTIVNTVFTTKNLLVTNLQLTKKIELKDCLGKQK